MNAPKTVVITGCSSGFGKVIAETLARKGYRVFASMRNANTRNAAARDELLELAGREQLQLAVIDLDVTDDASVEGAVSDVLAEAGKIVSSSTMPDTRSGDWQRRLRSSKPSEFSTPTSSVSCA